MKATSAYRKYVQCTEVTVREKSILVEYGFRLPAAMDNRPLKFEEFQEMAKQVIYVSATPADYELVQSEGIVVEQVIRPTGLLDPMIEVRPSLNQIDDLMEEIQLRIEKGRTRTCHHTDQTYGRRTDRISIKQQRTMQLHPQRCRYTGTGEDHG